MTAQLTAAIVRIVDANRRVSGAGFLVSERHVITCAHVVAEALGVPSDSVEAPTGQINIDFPLLAPGKSLTSRVVCWRPVQPEASATLEDGEDIAVLELESSPPEGSQPVRMASAEDLWGHSFRAFGFPVAYDKGVWASGVLRAGQASGWIQIEDVKETGYFVAQGFSGAPVWDEQADGVVGMIVVAEKRADVRAAFIIPTAMLVKTWPALTEQTIRINPYRGLFAFREEDAPYFFGREAFTEKLVEAAQKKPLIAVIGPSGSGKSSLVFAGLVPRLRQQGGWLTASFRPGDRPFQALVAGLMPLLEPQMSETDRLVETRKLASLWAKSAPGPNDLALQDLIERIVQKRPEARRLLLVVDQFEELYTLCRDAEERQRFVDLLLAALKTPSLALVVSMRADFLGHALSYRPLADALQDSDWKLGPMTRQEMQDAIEKPAQQLGVKIEDGLTERILDVISQEPGDLPLLEFALTLLWAKQSKGKLTHTAYDEIGGVEEALAGHAEEVYRGLSDEEQKRVQRVFTQLVRPGEGTADTRRMANRTEMREGNWDLVTRLADARLVVSGRDEATGDETVEIVHEALIGGWDRLREWVEADRKFLTWQGRLRAALHQWEAIGKDDGALLRGAPMAEAEQWLEERAADLNPAEQAFVRASLALRGRERSARERLRKWIMLGLVSGLVVAVVLALLAVFQWQRAEDQRQSVDKQRRAAVSRQLAAQALDQVDTKLDLALLLGLEATGMSDTVEARGSLLTALQSNPLLTTFLHGHVGTVFSVAFSPDGKMLASGGQDKTIVLWDVAARQPLGKPLTDHNAPVRSVAFSPDGKVLASGGEDGSISLWDVDARQPLGGPLTGHAGVVYSVAFSPDGKTLASAGEDKTVRLWDVAARQPLGKPLTGHQGPVYSVAFSPDGKTLASGSEDKTIILWDAATYKQRGAPLTAHEAPVYSVAFSPDSKTLASGGGDSTIRQWDAVTGQALNQPISDFRAGVHSVAFSPNGKVLAGAGEDASVRLWDRATQQSISPFAGHKALVRSVAFSPDSKTLASAGEDGSISLWDAGDTDALLTRPPHQRLGEPITGPNQDTYSMAFSPDGKLLATGHHGTVNLWDVAARQPLGEPLAGHDPNSIVQSLAFSPDSKTLASASSDGVLIVWDVAARKPRGEPLIGSPAAFSPNGKTLASITFDNSIILWDTTISGAYQKRDQLFTQLEALARGLAFSPDGKTLALAGEDGTIRLWDADTYQRLGEPIAAHTRPINGLAFSPDSKTLASASADATIMLWDVATRKAVGQPLTGHKDSVDSVAFSPDGKMLASANASGDVSSILLWDAANRQRLGQPLTNGYDQVGSIAFSPDSKLLASGWGGPNGIVLWDVSFESWRTKACNIVGRNLTQEEWGQYLGDEPYRKTCPNMP